MNFLLIAGKDEGFRYSTAYVCECSDAVSAEAVINSLRGEGYRIFKVYKHIARYDDIARVTKRFDPIQGGRIDER